MRFRRIRRAELPTATIDLARYLIGKLVVSEIPALDGGYVGRVVARIVETEAYLVGDAASHAYRGETPRNGAMFLRRGHAYVYFIYGTSYCLNVSGEGAGSGAAVLVRAAEPLAGRDAMRARRGDVPDRDLCRGPGRLARALGITRSEDRLDLCAPGRLRLAVSSDRDAPEPRILATRRIGLTREMDRPLRFVEAGSPFASGPAAGNRYVSGSAPGRGEA